MRERSKPPLDEAHRQQILQQIVDTLPYCIWWKDRNYVYLGTNRKNAHGAGLNHPDEIIGLTDYDLPWTEAEAAHYIQIDEEVMSSGEPRLNLEETQHQADGGDRVILTSKVPLRDASGKIFGIAGAWTDITDRKRMELDLKKAKEEAERASRTKSAFLATVSHELRTPISLILGPLDRLMDEFSGELSATVRAEIDRMHRNAIRLLLVVNDILDFSKAEAQKLQPAWEWTDVPAYTRTIMKDMRPMAAERSLTLSVVTKQFAKAPLDRQMYSRILLNLVSNAMKFSEPDTEVSVSVTPVDDDWFELVVEDQGIGISPQHLAGIFEKFAQVDSSATRKYEGTGLGLALVKQLTELMSGSVAVKSDLGKGSTFRIRLRRQPTEGVTVLEDSDSAGEDARTLGSSRWLAAVQRQRQSSYPPPPVSRSKPPPSSSESEETSQQPLILVVEDNDDMREFVREVLEPHYRVACASNGQQAQGFLKQQLPQAIISDVMMPVMSGTELVRYVKSEPSLKHIPIILLTARVGAESVVEGLEGGADEYLSKPFAAEELRARVRSMIRLHQAQAQLVELQKSALEVRMAGGFAHEMRNTLGAAMIFLKGAAGPKAAPISGDERGAGTAEPGAEDGGVRRNVIQESRDRLERLFSLIKNGTPAGSLSAAASDLEQLLQNTNMLDNALQETSRLMGRALSLTNEILDYSRIPQTARRDETIDLVEVADDVLGEFETRLSQHRVAVHRDYTDKAEMKGTESHVHSIIHNLVRNAYDAMIDNPESRIRKLEIAIKKSSGQLRLSVADTGGGMSDEVRAKIFEPFFSTRPRTGTGLGLGVVRKLVNAYNGAIRVESTAGEGSRFVITLPAARSETDIKL